MFSHKNPAMVDGVFSAIIYKYTDDVFMQMPFFGDFPASHVWLPAGLAFEALMHWEMPRVPRKKHYWLLVSNMCFSRIYGIIRPID